MTESNLKPYAAWYFEYDSSYRIRKFWQSGNCGCGGGASNGVHELTYDSNPGGSWNATAYDTDWKTRTVVDGPENWRTVYFDETGQVLADVVTDSDPASASNKWVTQYVRNLSGYEGFVTSVRTPAANSSYTHNTNTPNPNTPLGSISAASGAGLVVQYDRVSSTLSTKYFITEWGHRKGTSGTLYYDRSVCYADDTVGNNTPETTIKVTVGSTLDIYRPNTWWSHEYMAEGTSVTTPTVDTDNDLNATAYSSSLAIEKVERKEEVVSTGNNGSGSANVSSAHQRQDGRVDFTKSRDNRIDYRAYSNGQVTSSVTDADTTLTAGGQYFNGITIPTGFSATGTGKHLVTTTSYDAQGRVSTVITPQFQSSSDAEHARMYYTKLGDGRMVTVSIPYVKTVSSTVTYFGPAQYTVTNLAGKPEFRGTIAIDAAGETSALSAWIDEADADPANALKVTALTHVTTSLYNESGAQLTASRVYHLIPSPFPGSTGTNYDETTYGYDDAGRVRRTAAPTGTITRAVFDALGRPTESWMGTDDTGDAGSPLSGTNNMVKVAATTYDAGSAGGNSYVTKRTAYIQDNTTGQRETNYTPDLRGRVIIVDNPTGPDTLNKYNNLGQLVAVGTYTTSSGQTETSNPTSLTTNRVALVETSYDEQHRAFQTLRHQIAQSGLSAGTSGGTLLTSNLWFDAAGRVIKTRGEQLTKMRYDRLGRATNRFILAKVDDDSGGEDYSEADDVTGDTVLEERQTLFQDTTGLALMTVVVQRHPNDTSTTAELDTDNDLTLVDVSEVEGRAQITCNFYDELNRLTHTAAVGDYGGSDFDWDSDKSTTPGDNNLVTQYTYNTDGTLKDVTDPKGLVTRTLYDAAGRKIATIANYLNGTPSVATGDDDLFTRYEYANGLMTKLWVDVDGAGDVDAGTDQVTTYIYGTVKGTPSENKIATGHLLRAVLYPDTSNTGTDSTDINSDSSDVVSYAYNAQGQQVLVKDQAGNVIETTYDTLGRQTIRAGTTINTGAGFDDYVKRIETAYTSRGMVDTVTQYSATSGGSVRDQVQYTYDDWGNQQYFYQDPDSTIGGASGRDEFNFYSSYAAAAPTGGRSTLRRDSIRVNSTFAIYYEYGSSGSIADTASRVETIDLNSLDVAEYQYLGAGHLVATTLGTSSTLTSTVFDSSSTTYPSLDRFNRITSSRWTKGADLYRVDLTYDRDSNITRAEDFVHTWTGGRHLFDAAYTYDGLNRLTRAYEGHYDPGIPGIDSTKDTRDELWTALSHTGNWERRKLDLNADGDFTDTNELDDTSTFNVANEWSTRDTDSNSSTNYTLAYDAAGNMTDDGQSYKYVYDVFGRLVKVKNQSNATVAEYRYNGLGYRISWHYDADSDSDVDGSDPWYHFVYDDRWRPVATYRGTDGDAKEHFVYHNAGANGLGGSSYIDSIVLRDSDAQSDWLNAGDGTLEDRIFYCQNWRADVSVIVDSDATPIEWVKYSAYGVPSSYSLADFDHDGDVDNADNTAYFAAQGGSGPGWTDVNFDGDQSTSADDDAFTAAYNDASTGGPGVLSRGKTGNRGGYAGYQWDAATKLDHVRHRAYRPDLGRWTARDPLGYVDGNSMFVYGKDAPVKISDPWGLAAEDRQLPEIGRICLECCGPPPCCNTCGKLPTEGRCCCCVTNISGTARPDTGRDNFGDERIGHLLSVFVEMEFLESELYGEGDCQMEWWEKTNLPNRIFVGDRWDGSWRDQMATPANFTAKRQWGGRTKPCPGSSFVSLDDTPGLILHPGRTASRDLCIAVRVKSGAGCGCQLPSQTLFWKQVISIENGQLVERTQEGPSATKIESCGEPP